MICWEFHHEAATDFWYWRVLNGDGNLIKESTRKFPTFMTAFNDAKEHGFDESAHEWRLATAGDEPCVKVIVDINQGARQESCLAFFAI